MEQHFHIEPNMQKTPVPPFGFGSTTFGCGFYRLFFKERFFKKERVFLTFFQKTRFFKCVF